MAKDRVTLSYYLADLNSTKYAHATGEKALIAKRLIEIIISKGILNTAPEKADAHRKKEIAEKLNNAGVFAKLGIPISDVKSKIDPSLSDEQIDQIIDVIKTKIVVIRPIKTDPSAPESIHDYETYLNNTYNAAGLSIPALIPNSDGTNTVQIRGKYPHETDDHGDLEIVYNPNNSDTITAIKDHYLAYYESQISSLTFTPVQKTKAEFITLLSDIKNHNVTNINEISNPSIIDEIISDLNVDTTNQSREYGNTVVEIPATYIMGHQADKYKVVMKEPTFQKIETKLKTIFGNKADNNLSVTRVPADTLSVERFRARNNYIISIINNLLKEYSKKKPKDTMAADITIQKQLTIMHDLLDFNPSDYSSIDEITELIGGYVPQNKLDALLACAHELAKADFDFRKNFPNFIPVRIPTNIPIDSKDSDIPRIIAFEKEIAKAYKNCLPEMYHTDDYNFKRDRKKYPHESFKWVVDMPSIDDDNNNEYTQYYKSVYKDYVDYRKKDRPVKKITKAPGKLLHKFFNSNAITRTLKDIGLAIHINNHKVAKDGSAMTESKNRILGFFEKLRLTALLSGGGLVVKGLIAGFGTVSLGTAALAAGGAAVGWEFIAMCKRIYLCYREIMEARLSLANSEKGLAAAEPYRRNIERLEAADPVANAEEIAKNKEIVKAYIAYYIANYNKFLRSYDRVSKELKGDYKDDREQLMSEEEAYRTGEFAAYWNEAKPLVPRYTDLNPEEFDEKIEAIKNGRRRY